jgi:peptidyl-prolyl cis-trans isomerase C
MNGQSKVLAVVGGRTITEEDVQKTLMNLGQRAQQYNSPQGRQVILDQIINKELVLMDAKKNLYEHDAEFKAELEKLKNELLANFYVDKVLRDVKVKPEEVKAYFDAHSEEFQGEETVSARHILVETEEKAKDLLDKIQKGEMTFEEAAKGFSTCPSSERGGDLGEFGRGQMVPEFDQVAFEAEVGKVVGPVKTQFGYHLIKVENRKEASVMAFDEVKDYIHTTLLQQKQNEVYTAKYNELYAKYMK